MNIMQGLGKPSPNVLLLLWLAAGAAAFAQGGPSGPREALTAPVLIPEGYCHLVPMPLRAPLSQRLTPPRLRNLNGTSINWSGYSVATHLAAPQKGAVSAVEGSWLIPTVAFSGSAHTYSACWVGMDGSTIEQIGTEQDWTPRGQVNFVWFEMFPHSAYFINGFPIAAGDVFGAGVSYLGNGTFRLSITNFTRNVAYVLPTRYTRMPNAQRSSAEWVVEAPYAGGLLPLANFGTVDFAGCAARINGRWGPIDAAAWQAEAIDMETTSGWPKATSSEVSDAQMGNGTSSAFSVVWSHE